MRIAFITCENLSKFRVAKSNPVITHDDIALFDALVLRGHSVTPVFWNTGWQTLQAFDTCLLRSPWDYARTDTTRAQFREWLEHCRSQKINLINDPTIALWNLDKHYLADLERLDVPIIPTRFIEPSEHLGRTILREYFRKHGAFVLKPCISAGARDTFRIEREEDVDHLEDRNGHVGSDFARWRGQRSFMIQPYIANVTRDGEWSLMFFGEKYSHSVLKLPPEKGWLVQDELGGSVHSKNPESSIIACGEKTMLALNKIFPQFLNPLVYSRIDIINDPEHGPLVGELELIEPELFFMQRDPLPYAVNENAVNMFIEAVELGLNRSK